MIGVILNLLKFVFSFGISTFGVQFIFAVFHWIDHVDVANDISQTLVTIGVKVSAKSFQSQYGKLSGTVAVRLMEQSAVNTLWSFNCGIINGDGYGSSWFSSCHNTPKYTLSSSTNLSLNSTLGRLLHPRE